MAAAEKKTAKATPAVEKDVKEEVAEKVTAVEPKKEEAATKAVKEEPKTMAEEKPAKKTTTKKTTTKKTTTKAAEKTTAKAAEKTTAKKTTEKATPKKTAEKKTTTAKSQNVFIQYNGKEVNQNELIDKIIAKWCEEEGKRASSIKELNVYIKPEDNAAYYVINGQGSSIEL